MNSLETLPNFLTPEEFAKEIRTSLTSAYALLKHGEIGYVKSGRKILIPKTDFIAWLEANRVEKANRLNRQVGAR